MPAPTAEPPSKDPGLRLATKKAPRARTSGSLKPRRKARPKRIKK